MVGSWFAYSTNHGHLNIGDLLVLLRADRGRWRRVQDQNNHCRQVPVRETKGKSFSFFSFTPLCPPPPPPKTITSPSSPPPPPLPPLLLPSSSTLPNPFVFFLPSDLFCPPPLPLPQACPCPSSLKSLAPVVRHL